MEFKETTEAVKRIDIRAVLQALNIQYKQDRSGRVIFRLRGDDDKPSVSAIVQNGIWIFKDFGDVSIRGTVIDLYMHVKNVKFSQAVHELEKLLHEEYITKEKDFVSNSKNVAKGKQEGKENKVEILDATSFFLDAQKEYLKKRCVWPPIPAIKNVKYMVKNKVYYGIGSKMLNGHYVIRVPFSNSSIRYIYSGHSDVSFIEGQSEDIYIVEGLFDGLSMKKLFPEANVLVLNSVNNKHKAVNFLGSLKKEYKVFLALDNDEAGQETAKDLYEALSSEFFYYEGKDPNEYLCLLNKSKTA